MTKEELKQRLLGSVKYDISHAGLAKERFKESGDIDDLKEYQRYIYCVEFTQKVIELVEELED